MAYQITFDPALRRATSRLRGVVTGAEFGEAMRALYLADDWAPAWNALWDFTAVTELVVDPADVEAILAVTQACEHRLGSGRTAFVLRDDMHRVVAALLLHRTRGIPRERRLCSSLIEAQAWLDAPPEAAGGPDGDDRAAGVEA